MHLDSRYYKSYENGSVDKIKEKRQMIAAKGEERQ
jgi:hypothetical protein